MGAELAGVVEFGQLHDEAGVGVAADDLADVGVGLLAGDDHGAEAAFRVLLRPFEVSEALAVAGATAPPFQVLAGADVVDDRAVGGAAELIGPEGDDDGGGGLVAGGPAPAEVGGAGAEIVEAFAEGPAAGWAGRTLLRSC